MNILPLTVMPLARLIMGLYNYVNYKGVSPTYKYIKWPLYASPKFVYVNNKLYKPVILMTSDYNLKLTSNDEKLE